MPDNNIEWGQGGVNNNNDWGKAKANSTNNFGAVYDSSPSGDTNIAGGQPVVSITYSASAFCADASDPTPTIQNNAGAGTFSSTAGLVFISTTTGEVDIDASTVGSYLITYTDTDSATATFNLTINALPTVIVSASAGTICDGESTILTASGASTYVWNDGNTDNPRTVSPTTTTLFTATGTDSNGCTSSGGTTITVNALPTVSISGTLTYCAGASTTLDAGSFVSYLWSNGETTQTISATAGNYTVTVTDSNGCSNTSAQVTVTELALPTVAISGTLSYCAGSNTTLTATAGLSSYLWSSGETTQSITATAGSYTVTGTDANGCSTTSSSVTVTETALDDSSFSYASNTYRQDESDPTPTITGLTGGTFSGTTGLVIDLSTGVIDLSASTIASHTITYDTTSVGNDCPTSSTFALSVTAAVSAAFNYSASAYCQDASDPTPTITGTSGGTFTAAEKFSPFQMQFEVASGVSKTITIPGTVGSSYTVDWGDGATTTESTGTITHTYNDGNNTDVTNPTVSIGATGDTGVFGGLSFNAGGSATDLLEIQQWGSIDFIYLYKGFSGCSNMQITAIDSPNLLLSGIGSSTSLQEIFFNCTALTGNSYISNWNVSNVVTFLNAFKNCLNFNVDISSWDMSNVGNASAMLHTATSFDQPIGSWDLTSATTIAHMLRGTSINQNLGGWSLRTASAPNMTYFLFSTASMSNANITDSVVGWANYVYNNTAPFNVSCVGNSINARFDGTRSGGANFATAADAKTYLTTTAGWTIN